MSVVGIFQFFNFPLPFTLMKCYEVAIIMNIGVQEGKFCAEEDVSVSTE
jgi:hypothetical protein